jgi:hypothetical protein
MARAGIFEDWACDVSPSVPGPVPPTIAKVPMGGFCFHEGGIAVDVTAAEVEMMSHPPIGPTTNRDNRETR